jgi:putative DNA primase/helicase
MLLHDRQITISVASHRTHKKLAAQTLFWSELITKLSTPARSTETLAAYLALPKSQQDDLKDVGGFVAGSLVGGRRKSGAVISRDILTLDLDNIPAGGTQDVLNRLNGLGCSYAVYSTRKHYDAKPRLRVLMPCDRSISADEYEPIALKIADIIGMGLCDPTTFEATRLMYWPSCCADGVYVFTYVDKPSLSANGILGMYTDWRNMDEWPQVPGAAQKHVRLAVKQGDPLEKSGVVGAFCKTYDIYTAMDKFLPGVYTPCDGTEDRYTYLGGSTVGGAVMYDNGKFLFSHHATDPCSGKLVNAFDLVRLHKFTDKDDEAKPDTPTNKLPSYMAMCEFVIADTHVAAILNQDRYEKAVQDFGTVPEDTVNWISKLAVSASTGTPAKTIKNVRIVLDNDPRLKGRIKMDTFSEFILGVGPLPWEGRNQEQGTFRWSKEDDSAGLRDYIEQTLGFRVRDVIDDALRLCSRGNGFNPLTTLLQSLSWDGVPRLDTLYIDYLGADDHIYTRSVTRKAFTAAVARVMDPGCKFDTMTVVCGRQGLGKSTLFRKMGLEWFSDSIRTFEGKDAAELLQGVWIVEIGELEAFNKTDIKTVKQFLSKCDDQYRAAYAQTTEKHLRRCVFFGTTNDHEYLKDTTGNRRFWPVDTEVQKPTKLVFDDLTKDEIEQIWAEAFVRWQSGETLFLSTELEAEAEKRRSTHMERDPLQGQIEAFLDKPIPLDWSKWTLDRRRMFWGGGMMGPTNLEQRDRVCALEVWKECLCEQRTMTKADSNRISNILEAMPEWQREGLIRFGSSYGSQRGFKRKISVNILPKNGQFVNILKNEEVNRVNIQNAQC